MARKKKVITVKGSTKKKQAQKKKGISQQQSLTVNVITGRRKASGKIAVRPAKPPIIFSPVINLGKAENTLATPTPTKPPAVADVNKVSFIIPQTTATPGIIKPKISFQTDEPEFFNVNFSQPEMAEPIINKSQPTYRLEPPTPVDNVSQTMRYEDETIKPPTNPRDMLEMPIEAVDMLNLPYTKFILPPPIKGNQSVGLPPSSRSSKASLKTPPSQTQAKTPVFNTPPSQAKEMPDETPILDDEIIPEPAISPETVFIKRGKGRPIKVVENPTPKEIKKMEKARKERERYQNQPEVSPETVFIKRGKGRPIKVVENPTPKEIKKMEKARKERERYQNQPEEIRAEKALVISSKRKEKNKNKNKKTGRVMKESNLDAFFNSPFGEEEV